MIVVILFKLLILVVVWLMMMGIWNVFFYVIFFRIWYLIYMFVDDLMLSVYNRLVVMVVSVVFFIVKGVV